MSNGTALCLSGGGFRATLFHLGAVWRLNELGLLPGLDCISVVSGGSILGAWLGLNWTRLDFDAAGIAGNYSDLIATPIRKFCSKDLDRSVSLANFAMNCFGGTTRFFENSYARRLLGDAQLSDLPAPGEGPRFLFNAANLNTGVGFYIDRAELRDSRLGRLPDPSMSLARAVAVCSALPPFLSPVYHFTDPAKWESTPEADLFEEERLRAKLALTDAGVMDALGVMEVWNDYSTVLVSDASQVHETWRRMHPFWITQLVRSISIRTRTNSELRRDLLLDRFASTDPAQRLAGTYWNHSQRIADFGLSDTLCMDNEATASLKGMRTRLLRFTDEEQGKLINWGYALSDAAIRAHVTPQAPAPVAWPVLEHGL